MNAADFAKKLGEKQNLTKAKAEKNFKEVLECLFEAVQEDGSFRTSYGTFSLVETAARKGRNPKTGEELQIPAKKKIVFKMSKNFKEELN